MPYEGFGRLWLRADGWLLLELEAGRSTAFPLRSDGLILADRIGDGSDTLLTRSRSGRRVVHDFAQRSGTRCGAVFVLTGQLQLEYAERTGALHVTLRGDAIDFEAQLRLRTAAPAATQPSEAAAGTRSDCTCECYCSAPCGGSCSACKRCPDGYTCSCTCRCYENGSNNCTCSTCARVRHVEGEVEEIDPEPNEP